MNCSQVPAAAPSPSRTDLPVRKTITVAAPPERAFQVFTGEMSVWWPLATHHIGSADAERVVIEPFAGGRWFERVVDGSECDWGRVLVWEPPRRLVLSWEITSDWRHDPSIQTEVEVRFTADGAATRVDLEHRLLHRYGEQAARMRGILDSKPGWAGLLEAFADRASRP